MNRQQIFAFFFIILCILFYNSCSSKEKEGLSANDIYIRDGKEYISVINLRNKFITVVDRTTLAETLELYEYEMATSTPIVTTFQDPRPITNEYGKSKQYFDKTTGSIAKAELIVQDKQVTAIRLRKNAITTLFTSADFRELKESKDASAVTLLPLPPLPISQANNSNNDVLYNPFFINNVTNNNNSIDPNNYILKTKIVPCVPTKVNIINTNANYENNIPNDMLPKNISINKENKETSNSLIAIVQNQFKKNNWFDSNIYKEKSKITFDISSFACPNAAYDCNGSGHPNSIK